MKKGEEMNFNELLGLPYISAGLPNVAKLLLPSTLSAETKKNTMKLTPDELGSILKSAIDQIDTGSVESADALVRKVCKVKKRLVGFLFIAYVLFILCLTLFTRQPRIGDRIFKWELFWSFRAWIAGEIYGKTESIQNINNFLAFIPFGVLSPIKRWIPLLIVVITFSAAIEVIQYIANLGWCEIDDVISNVADAMLGFGLLNWIKR